MSQSRFLPVCRGSPVHFGVWCRSRHPSLKTVYQKVTNIKIYHLTKPDVTNDKRLFTSLWLTLGGIRTSGVARTRLVHRGGILHAKSVSGAFRVPLPSQKVLKTVLSIIWRTMIVFWANIIFSKNTVSYAKWLIARYSQSKGVSECQRICSCWSDRYL